MADMGTKEASEKWGVPRWKVSKWCRESNDSKITQDKPGMAYSKGLPESVYKDLINGLNPYQR